MAELGRVGWDPTGQMAAAGQRRVDFINRGGYATQRRESLSGGGGGSSRSSSGFRQKSPTGSIASSTTTVTPPNIPTPTLGPAPVFQLPTRDEARIRRLQQEAAAPGVRETRRATRQALLRHLNIPGNRAVQAELTRGLLSGHGDALSKIMGSARREGRAQYEAEYAPQVQKAQAEFGAQQQARMASFQAAWQNYMGQFARTQTQTQKNIYSSARTGGSGQRWVPGLGYTTPGIIPPLGSGGGARSGSIGL